MASRDGRYEVGRYSELPMVLFLCTGMPYRIASNERVFEGSECQSGTPWCKNTLNENNGPGRSLPPRYVRGYLGTNGILALAFLARQGKTLILRNSSETKGSCCGCLRMTRELSRLICCFQGFCITRCCCWCTQEPGSVAPIGLT